MTTGPLSLSLVLLLSLLPHTITNQKPINSPRPSRLSPSLSLPLSNSSCPLYSIPSFVPHQNIMNTKATLHVSPLPSPLIPPLSHRSPLFLYPQAPPCNPCSLPLCCFRTGFLSADGVSLLCSFSSKGI